MNNRRKLIFALGTAGSFPFAAVSQQPKKIYRIGFVTGRPRLDEPSEAFRQRLRELGYVEGKNLVIEWRFLQARADRALEVAAEFVRLNLDCMAAAGVGPIRAAKQATTSIPIVMINVDADPVSWASSRAWHGPAATSRDSPPSRTTSRPNAWSC